MTNDFLRILVMQIWSEVNQTSTNVAFASSVCYMTILVWLCSMELDNNNSLHTIALRLSSHEDKGLLNYKSEIINSFSVFLFICNILMKNLVPLALTLFNGLIIYSKQLGACDVVSVFVMICVISDRNCYRANSRTPRGFLSVVPVCKN